MVRGILAFARAQWRLVRGQEFTSSPPAAADALQPTASSIRSCLELPLSCCFRVYGYRPFFRYDEYPRLMSSLGVEQLIRIISVRLSPLPQVFRHCAPCWPSIGLLLG